MKRKIKSMAAFRIDVPPEGEFDDFRDKQRIDYLSSKYDEHGNTLEENKFDDYGEVTGKSVYNYDVNGRLTGEETYNEFGYLEEKLSYERDENGRVVKQFIHYLDETRDTIFYEYNGDGNLTRKILKDEDGEIEREEKIEYSGEFIVGEEVIEEGETVKKTIFKLDEKGRVIEAELMNEEEEYTLVNEYDEKGNRTKTLKYSPENKLLAKQQFRYDDRDRVIEITEEDPYKKNRTIIEYDEKGNATTQKELNRNGVLNHELERDYDEDGNITEVRAFVSDQGQGIGRKYVLIYEYGFFEP
jgi:hypothetical protein